MQEHDDLTNLSICPNCCSYVGSTAWAEKYKSEWYHGRCLEVYKLKQKIAKLEATMLRQCNQIQRIKSKLNGSKK